MTPNNGPAAGGTSVTITGTNLTGASGVSFGGTLAASFTPVDATTVTATSPTHTAGTVDVRVTTGAGQSAVNAGDHFTYNTAAPLPAVTKVKKAPKTKALITGGDGVIITGTGFTLATAVSFGADAAASFTINSDTQITAVTPAVVNAGPVDVTVTSPGGTSLINKHDVYKFKAVAPTVTSVTPNTGPAAGGTSITITGTFFTPTTTIKVGSGAATSVVCATTTTCTAVTPPGTAGKIVDIVVKANKKSSKKVAADKFTYS